MRGFRIFLIISVLLMMACVVTISCVKSGVDRPIVTVTIPPQKYLAEQIAGNKLEIRCLLSNGADPETYDPTVTNMMNLDKSIAFLRVGNVGFEDAILGKISTVNADLPVYDTSRGIDLIKGTHSHHHHPDMIEKEVNETDPHTWSSVKNARIMAGNILEALVEVDPANKRYYTRNCDRFIARLDSLDKAFAARIDSAGRPSFIVWHPTLSYFARDYGLKQIAIGGDENKEISPAAMREAIDKARQSEAGVFFFQKDVDNRRLEAVNASIGARGVAINPLSADWETEMNAIVDALSSL